MDIKQFISNLNSKGIPIPLIKYEGRGNLSATVFWLATTLVLLGFGVNIAAYVCSMFGNCGDPKYFPMTEVLAWFGTCSIPYIFRKKDEGNEPKTI